ncbi:MAG: ComEC/Rec2 family competence protein [Leptolyngbyaceae bacterium]|nr:ComEC/Rec2 family competence protein [Leptolyngbyaceae bacterium]
MQSIEFYGLCLAYLAGLLMTAVPQSVYGVSVGAIALLLSSITSAALLPRLWRTGPNVKFWLLAGFFSLVAFGHLQLRTPSPGPNDLSLWQQRINPEAVVTVSGKIIDDPQLNRSQRVKFVLKAERATVQAGDTTVALDEAVTGKAYTTVDILQGTGRYPGEWVQVRGTLYLPDAAQNPGGFDFRAYLAQQGIFSGLQGEHLTHLSGHPSIVWNLRQRVVRGLVRRLGTPNGTLLSAMILGRRAVDLPYDIRDAFTQAGLAHTIAASGFHVSILLGVVMVLAQRTSPKMQCWIGSGVLLLYIGLTGAQASVIRAGCMGFAALLGGAMERRSKPVPMLLLIATGMLVVNPLWVFDLGFQFSFLATLGLLVLVPALTNRLDWMPTGIATLVSVPIAAYVWVMPIQMQVFGAIPTYSIGLNVLTTPLILLISLGGMVSGAIALLSPSLGSLVAWCLHLPITLLIGVVELWNRLPGSTIITGSLTTFQVLLMYAAYGMVWWRPQWQKRWGLVLLSTLALISAPMAYGQLQQQSITVLSNSQGPALVVRDRGTVGLIFSGTDSDVAYTVMPFLRSHGIGKLDWAIALDATSEDIGWPRILETLSVHDLYYPPIPQVAAEPVTPPDAAMLIADPPEADRIQNLDWIQHALNPVTFEAGQQIRAGRTPIQFLASSPPILRFQMGDSRWLVCDRQQSTSPAPTYESGIADIVWWSGDEMDAPWIEGLGAEVAIAPTLNGDIRTHGTTPDTITTAKIHVYQTDHVGALQWTPSQGITQLTTNEETY